MHAGVFDFPAGEPAGVGGIGRHDDRVRLDAVTADDHMVSGDLGHLSAVTDRTLGQAVCHLHRDLAHAQRGHHGVAVGEHP